MRLHAELLECERHGQHYGGTGSLTHIICRNGTVASVPQVAQALLVAMTAERIRG